MYVAPTEIARRRDKRRLEVGLWGRTPARNAQNAVQEIQTEDRQLRRRDERMRRMRELEMKWRLNDEGKGQDEPGRAANEEKER